MYNSFKADRPNILPTGHHVLPTEQIFGRWPFLAAGGRWPWPIGVLLVPWTVYARDWGTPPPPSPPPVIDSCEVTPVCLSSFWTFAYRVVFHSLWVFDLFIELYSHLFGYIMHLFCLSSCKSVHYLSITMQIFSVQNKFNFVYIVVWYLVMRCIESLQIQHLLNKMVVSFPSRALHNA